MLKILVVDILHSRGYSLYQVVGRREVRILGDDSFGYCEKKKCV